MIDVPTGTGALAVGFVEAFPQLYVTGIDAMAHVLGLARPNVAASPAAARIELRTKTSPISATTRATTWSGSRRHSFLSRHSASHESSRRCDHAG